MRRYRSILAVPVLMIALCSTACSAPVANAENVDGVRGHWLTEDEALIIEVMNCEEGVPVLCGFVRALPGAATDPELAQHATELCALPLLSNLTFEKDSNRWGGGDIFDPEIEQMYQVYIQLKPDHLKVRAYEGSEWIGETLKWTAVESEVEDCATTEPSQ